MKAVIKLVQYRNHPDGNATNFSTSTFTNYQFKLLNKNLNFCPQPGYINKTQINKDIKQFTSH